jgi:hypothetical protein
MAIQKGGKLYTDSNVLIGNLSGGFDFNYTAKTEETAVPSDTANKPEPVSFSGSCTLNGQYNPADSGQADLITKILAGTHITAAKAVYSGVANGASGVGFTGEAVLTDLKIGAKYGAYQSFSCTFQTYGAWTQSSAL